MNLKNLEIGTQLKLGFALLLLFVVVLGAVSYTQTDQIHLQSEKMYNNSLKVRLAIGTLNQVILSMRVNARDLILAKTNQEKQVAKQLIEVSALSALQQFNVLDTMYLGPRSDMEEARAAFAKWNTVRDEEFIKLALSGDIEKVKANILPDGLVGVYRERMLTKIKKIDDFAKNQADALYATSIESTDSL
ncbi:MAG: MCP four helix bundle domain-containing protein, partial [Pedobacter sp.]